VTVGKERVYISANSEEEYYAKAMAAKTAQIEIKKAAPRITLGTAIDTYINDNDQVLSPSTINAYKSYRNTRFNNYMDEDIALINYQRMVNDECRKVAPKTVHNAYRLVTASLRHANAEVPAVNLPKKSKPERPWLDYTQIQKFIVAIKGKPYELGALLALNGLRRSEILHLTSDDVDTERGIIHVRGASVVGEGNKLIDKDTNKTTSSSRDVNIVIPRINDLIANKNGRLITTNPTTLYGSINDVCRSAGLPEVGVHGLRHSFASLAYHLRWSEATTMREGGWSDPAVVHRIYTHLANQDANEDIKSMQDFYSSK
jgi:integrase